MYLCKSTIWPCMKCCCHVWAGAPSCNLELLDKPQKRMLRAVGPSPPASFEPLALCQNVGSLSLFYGYYFGRFSFQLAQLVPLSYYQWRSICSSNRLNDFSVTNPRYCKHVYVNFFFLCTARISLFHMKSLRVLQKVAKRLWPALFITFLLHFFYTCYFLVHTLSSSAGK